MENRAQNVSKKALKVNKVLAIVSAFAIGLGAFCSPMTAFAGDSAGAYDVLYGAYRLFYGEYVNIFEGAEGDSHSANLVETLFDQDELNFLMVYNLVPSSHVSKNYYQQGLDFTISFSTHVFSHGNGRNCLFDPINLRDFSVVVYYTDGTFNRIGFSYVFDVTNYNYRMSVECYGFKNKDIENIQIRYYADYFELFEAPYTGSILYMNSVSLDDLYRFDSLSTDDVLGSVDDSVGQQLELTGNIWEDLKIIGSNILNLPSRITDGLRSFFTNLQTAVGNVANGVVNGLSSILNNIKVAVDAVGASVALTLDPILSAIKFAIGAVAQQIYDRFSTYIAQWEELFSILTDRSSFGEINGELSGVGSDVEESIGNIVPLDKPSFNELPNIEDYVPSTDSYFIVLMRRLFEREHILFLSAMALAFGVTGYLLYGKR